MTMEHIGDIAAKIVGRVQGDAPLGVARHESFVQDFYERYFDRYIEEPMSGCWLWIGSRTAAGYGNFTLNRRVYYAHRTGFEALRGEGSSVGFVVRHRCDVRCCVNPDHLVLGLPIDNVEDAWRRNRMNPAVGEAVSHAVMTEADVIKARQMAASGAPINDISSSLGFSRSAIESSVIGRTWKHVPGALQRDELTHSPPHQNRPSGPSHFRSRLSMEQVVSIRERLSRGEKGIDLAAEFRVAKSTISAIRTGQNRRNG